MRRLSGSQDGFGGDLRYGEADGLAGADKICTEIAEYSMPGSGAKGWRAFLSTSTADAIDRIGSGPWYDRLGRIVSEDIAGLLNTRPAADAAIVNDLPNEYGIPNRYPNGDGVEEDNHHVLTGSGEDGRLYNDNYGDTCNDWTNAVGEIGSPRCGMAWPRGMGGVDMGSHWISDHTAYGCAPGVSIIQDGGGDRNVLTVGEGGGYGAIYCFALTP